MSFYVYVVDERHHLVGVVSLRQLLLNTPSTPLKKIMSTDVIKATTSTDQEEVARIVASYNLLAVPVVDAENKMVGIVTVDDVIDVIREEATEDIYALAGVEADDRAAGTALNSVRRRLPWLTTTLGTSLLAAAVVNLFADTLARTVAFAVLLPVIVALGSNAATQTMTVIVRGLGLNEVSWDRWSGVLRKELAAGLGSGAVVGLLGAVAAGVWFRDIRVGVVVGLAITLNTVLATCVGTLVPLLLKRLKVDPAIASSVFVLTVTLVLGLLLYLAAGAVVMHL
jgi:magnesium transporter